MSNYKLIDETSGESKTIGAETLDQAMTAARDWMRGCEWENDETIWVSCSIVDLDAPVPEGEDDEDWYRRTYAERVTVTINPPEPECIEAEHDWQSPFEIVGGIKENPGVWGHGGGVVIHEVCLHCGCERVTDTWAQDRNTGRQGLESVAYHPVDALG